MLALADPRRVADAPELPLAVDTAGGPAWGSTVVDFRAPVFARLADAEQSRPPGFFPWRIASKPTSPGSAAHVTTLFGG